MEKATTPDPLLTLLLQIIHSPASPPAAQQEILKSAATSQYEIGWQNLFRGHLSNHWRTARRTFLSDSKLPDQQALTWSKTLIRAIWKYSLTLWDSRNKVVHGLTSNTTESKALRLLKNETTQYYQVYAKDPHMIQASRSFLFDRPLPIMQQLPRQQLECWLSPVREAIATRPFSERTTHGPQPNLMKQFFQQRKTHS